MGKHMSIVGKHGVFEMMNECHLLHDRNRTTAEVRRAGVSRKLGLMCDGQMTVCAQVLERRKLSLKHRNYKSVKEKPITCGSKVLTFLSHFIFYLCFHYKLTTPVHDMRMEIQTNRSKRQRDR